MFKKGKEATKKGKRKKAVIAVILTAAVAGTAGTAVYRKMNVPSPEMTGNQEANETKVTLGTISNTIIGTGNLELDEAEAVTVPSGITIKEVFAESGDYVSAGTVLATVEESSVLSAVEDIQEELEALDGEISQCQEDEDENTITSSVSGRVKDIYVEAGSSVTETMLDTGALMTLSLDGQMAVDMNGEIQAEEGEQTEVLLPDGTTVNGTVESADGEGCTVTIGDETASPGDMVTVKASDGTSLGSGELYIHRPLEITGTAGTVAEVSVTVNETVEPEDELLVLEGTESDAEYEELLAVREARAATLTALLQLAENTEITADYNGTVQDVNVAASQTSSSEGTSGSVDGDTAAAAQMSYTRTVNNAAEVSGMLLSFDDGTSAGTISSDPLQQILFSVGSTGTSSSSLLVIPAPEAGGTPVAGVTSSDGIYTGIVTWNPMDESFEAGVSYQALVILTAADGYCFGADSIQGTETGTISGIQVSEDGSSIEFQIAFPAIPQETEITVEPDEETDNGNTEDSAENDQNVTEENAEDEQNTGTENPDVDDDLQNSTEETETGGRTDTGTMDAGTSAASGTAGSGQSGSSMMSGSSGTGAATSQQGSDTTEMEEDVSADGTVTSSQYSTDVTAFTISPDENMVLTVSVDELDINSIELGQTAEITFDAIENKEFQGEVTKIGNTASVNGGVAKYSVELTIPTDEEMKEGMNASATITIEEREQVLTLPMNALQEQGDRTFVYTEKEDDGTLSGEVEITTGLSDGTTVEITDGLEEGDTVYYIRTGGGADTVSGEEGFGNGETPDRGSFEGGEMPGGGFGDGEMPDMGGQRGGGPGMQE